MCAFYICVNMLDQTQYSLISPFCSYSFKTGVHFWFYCEILNVIYMAFAKDMFDFLKKIKQ